MSVVFFSLTTMTIFFFFFFFSSRRRHTRLVSDWSSDVCSSDLVAYRRAATLMRETPASIAQLALEGKAKSLNGIGKTIEEKIVQVVEAGEIKALHERKERIPAGLIAFMRLPGLGPKTARRIWQELGVTTVEELKAAAEQQRLRSLPGLGAKTEENVLRALAAEPAGPPRTLLGKALPSLRAAVE